MSPAVDLPLSAGDGASAETPEVSVVMPVRNGVPLLGAQLDAMCTEHVVGGFEVVVVDNGSTDGTRALAESFVDRLMLRVVDCTLPGVARARNVGVRASRGAKVLFLDDDDEIEPGYIAAMSAALDHFQIVGARIDPSVFSPGGVAREIPQVRGLGQGWRPWAYGATLGIRRSIYEAIGGCDEDLGYASEDIDLCWRAGMAGATLGWVPEATLRYRVRRGTGDLFRQGRSYGRGGGQIDARFQPFGHVTLSTPRLMRLLVSALVRFLLARSPLERERRAFLLGRRVGSLEARLHRDGCRPVDPDGRLQGEPRSSEG